MGSYETINDVTAPNSSDSAPVQVSQQMPGVPQRCRYDESQQNAVDKNWRSSSQRNAASISRSFSCEAQVFESSSAAIYAPPNNLELENVQKPMLSTSHAPKFGRSSLAVPKLSGIGLHLNNLVKALPLGCGATLKSADKDDMIVQGKKSFCTTDSHLTQNAVNPPTSAKAVDGLLKPSEHHSTACDKRERTKLSPQKKRKRSMSSSDGDGCKLCNCKKTKCLKLYCDCFASGYYCTETCSCQGCFNTPEYEDKVIETRRQIVSRDPFAFAPKVLQRVCESPANNTQDIYKSTPSSAMHKRGCSCKTSMCLKRYCECYQSNVGCSDGCRFAGCKNGYGKKEESGSGKHIATTEAANDMPEISFDQELDAILHSLSIPDDMTNDTSSQPCPGSGSFSLLNSSQLSSSSITSMVPSGENQRPMVLDSDSWCNYILEDPDIEEILKEHSVSTSELEVRSPPRSLIPELKPFSSITRLAPGRKLTLKAVASFPTLASCTDPGSASSPSTNASDSRNI